MSRRGYEGNEHLEQIVVDGVFVDIYGCFSKDTDEGCYDFYDLYAFQECINEGAPCYSYPTDDVIKAFLELREELQLSKTRLIKKYDIKALEEKAKSLDAYWEEKAIIEHEEETIKNQTN